MKIAVLRTDELTPDLIAGHCLPKRQRATLSPRKGANPKTPSGRIP